MTQCYIVVGDDNQAITPNGLRTDSFFNARMFVDMQDAIDSLNLFQQARQINRLPKINLRVLKMTLTLTEINSKDLKDQRILTL